jgi:hypothetical protein
MASKVREVTQAEGGSNGSIRTISKAYRLGTETISALPPITPLYDPCLVTGRNLTCIIQ